MQARRRARDWSDDGCSRTRTSAAVAAIFHRDARPVAVVDRPLSWKSSSRRSFACTGDLSSSHLYFPTTRPATGRAAGWRCATRLDKEGLPGAARAPPRQHPVGRLRLLPRRLATADDGAWRWRIRATLLGAAARLQEIVQQVADDVRRDVPGGRHRRDGRVLQRRLRQLGGHRAELGRLGELHARRRDDGGRWLDFPCDVAARTSACCRCRRRRRRRHRRPRRRRRRRPGVAAEPAAHAAEPPASPPPPPSPSSPDPSPPPPPEPNPPPPVRPPRAASARRTKGRQRVHLLQRSRRPSATRSRRARRRGRGGTSRGWRVWPSATGCAIASSTRTSSRSPCAVDARATAGPTQLVDSATGRRADVASAGDWTWCDNQDPSLKCAYFNQMCRLVGVGRLREPRHHRPDEHAVGRRQRLLLREKEDAAAVAAAARCRRAARVAAARRAAPRPVQRRWPVHARRRRRPQVHGGLFSCSGLDFTRSTRRCRPPSS